MCVCVCVCPRPLQRTRFELRNIRNPNAAFRPSWLRRRLNRDPDRPGCKRPQGWRDPGEASLRDQAGSARTGHRHYFESFDGVGPLGLARRLGRSSGTAGSDRVQDRSASRAGPPNICRRRHQPMDRRQRAAVGHVHESGCLTQKGKLLDRHQCSEACDRPHHDQHSSEELRDGRCTRCPGSQIPGPIGRRGSTPEGLSSSR